MTRPIVETSDELAERVVHLYVVEEVSVRTIAEVMSVGHKRVNQILTNAGVRRRTNAEAQEIVARRLVEKMAGDSDLAKRVQEWGASAVVSSSDFRVLREWPSGASFEDVPSSLIAAENRRMVGRMPPRRASIDGSLTGNSGDMCAL